MSRIPSPKLEVRDLQLVLALYKAKTTARAAEILHLAQPSVSRALLSLEDRIGTKLFTRTSSGLIPSVQGEKLIEKAHALLNDFIELEQAVRVLPPEPQNIRIVGECYTAYHWLPTALMSIQHEFKNTKLILALEHTNTPIEALTAHQLDVGLLISQPTVHPELNIDPLFKDELLFLVGNNHTLAQKETLSSQDLHNTRILCIPPRPHEKSWFLSKVFGKNRPHLNVLYVPSSDILVDLVVNGLGIGIATEWSIGEHMLQREFCLKRLAKNKLYRQWYFVWRKEINHLALHLKKLIEESKPKHISIQ